MVIDRERQLTIEEKRSIAEETRSIAEETRSIEREFREDRRKEGDRKILRPKNRGNVHFNFDEQQGTAEKLNDKFTEDDQLGDTHEGRKDEKSIDEHQKQQEKSPSQLVQSYGSSFEEDTMLEFEFIYSINEKDAGSRSQSHSESQGQPQIQYHSQPHTQSQSHSDSLSQSQSRSRSQSQSQSRSQSKSQSHSQSKTRSKSTSHSKSGQEIKKPTVQSIAFGRQNAIDRPVETKSDEQSFSRETVEVSKVQRDSYSESKADTFSVSYAGRKLFEGKEQKEINYSNDANLVGDRRDEKEEVYLTADRKEQLDAEQSVGEHLIREQLDRERLDVEQSEKKQLDVRNDVRSDARRAGDKQVDKEGDKQRKVASKQIAIHKQVEQFEGEHSKQTNEVNSNREHLVESRSEFNLIRSRQLFADKPDGDLRSSAESRSDYERERPVYKLDQAIGGSKRKTASSSDYKANTADYDLSHNLNDLICSLHLDRDFDLNQDLLRDLQQDLIDHSGHRTLPKQVGKDAIKGEQLNRTIGRANEQQQIRANETTDATKLPDYARRESVRQICEEIREEFREEIREEISEELYETSGCRLESHQRSYERVCDSELGVDSEFGIDSGSDQFAGERRDGEDGREKRNAKDESRKDYRSSRETRPIRRYLPDDLEENLSWKTPSPNSLGLDLLDSTDELPDLLLSSPTLSTSSSFPSMDSLSTLISSPSNLFDPKRCSNCSRRPTNPSFQSVRRPDENEPESRRVERKSSNKEDKEGSTKDEKMQKKRIERNRERKITKIVDHRDKKNKKFSFEEFWDDVLRDESSSEDRLVGLDRLKRKLIKLNQKVINRKGIV